MSRFFRRSYKARLKAIAQGHRKFNKFVRKTSLRSLQVSFFLHFLLEPTVHIFYDAPDVRTVFFRNQVKAVRLIRSEKNVRFENEGIHAPDVVLRCFRIFN